MCEKLYTTEDLREIFEYNLNDLKTGADSAIRARAKKQNLASWYQGLDKDGVINYETRSITTPNVEVWRQKIKLLDLQEAIDIYQEDGDITEVDVANLVTFGDLAVWCDDPSFLYWGWQYIAWQLGYGIEKMDIKPDIRNPKRKGTVCKHLYTVFTVMPMHMTRITKDLKNSGLLEG